MSDPEKLLRARWENTSPKQMLRESLPQGDEIEPFIEAEDASVERERREREENEAARAIDSPTEDEEEVASGPEEPDEPLDLEQQGQSEDDGEYGDDEDETRTSSKPSSSRPSRPTTSISTTASTLKNEALASAISVKARLPPCATGAVEMMTFFPLHDQWPEAGLRLFRNGWRSGDVAKIQLFARNKLTKEAHVKKCNALKHSVIRNGKIFFEEPNFAPTKQTHLMTPVTSYDATSYEPRNGISSHLMDAKLVDIAEGVVNWPTGEDRGIVTQAIEYAHQHSFGQYTTADIPQLAQQMSFSAPSDASRTDWDQRALQRVKQIAGP